MKMSNQAQGAIMLALQKSLMEQSDIVPVLSGFDFKEVDGELFVENPPTLDLSQSQEVDYSSLVVEEE